MPNVDSHAPGSFCWIELGTSDQNAAKQFYGSVLGWTAFDSPMGPDATYTMFQLDGRNIGGCYSLRAANMPADIPPNWMLYIATANADETVAKVGPAGGKVMNGPFDVMDFGRMAVLQDVSGAPFSIWEPKTHPGIGIVGVPGSLCWADVTAPDTARTAEFYKQVFGWTVGAGSDSAGYLEIKNGDQMIGGIRPPALGNPGAPPHWLLYFLVKDCDASTEKAGGAGASVYMPPTSMKGVGRWSVIADPQGAAFSLFQPESWS